MTQRPVKTSNKKIWFLVFILGISGVGGATWWYVKTKNGGPKRTFKEHKIEKGDLEVFVQATGQVQPENRLVVKPSISGRIEEVTVDEGRSVKAGQILAWMSSNDRAALLDMAKAKGVDEIKHWETIYKPSPIIAPLSGFIISKNIERGQVVAASDTAFVISDRLVINAQVDETDLARVKMNQDVTIQLDAYSDQPIKGRVGRIAFEARTANNVTVYDIRVIPEAVPDFMRSGMTASIRFIETTRTDVLKIPTLLFKKKKSIKELRRPGSELPLIVKTGEKRGEPTFADKVVKLGATDGRMVEVVSGLDGTETLLEDTTPEDAGGSSNPFSPFGGSKKLGGGGRGKK